MPRSMFWLALGCLAFGFAQADQAQAKGGRFLGGLLGGAAKAAGTNAGRTAIKTYGADVLTPDQLTVCLKKAVALDEASEALASEEAGLSAKWTEIETSKKSIEQAGSKVNQGSKTAVDRYNRSIDAHNSLLQNYRTAQSSYNAKVKNRNATIVEYNRDCTKSYYSDDMDIAKANLKLN